MVTPERTDNPQTTQAEKSQLRKRMMGLRADTLRKAAGDPAAEIARHGLAFLRLPADSIVSAYMAMPEELDPALLVRRLHSQGRQIVMPVVVGKAQPLVFRLWQPGDEMMAGPWGIREPLAEKPELMPDVMLVPLLAFDAKGGRLGFGGGYYDRTMRRLRARSSVVAVGVALDVQEVDDVPMGPQDERLDWILTPAGARRCGG